MFIHNAWYVAGFGSELENGKLLTRTFLGERVVIFRTSDGSPAALYDRCPHRFVPLHIGKVKGDRIQCGYHGLEFGADGQCKHNPHGTFSSALRVTSYPLEERDGILWIWMGDAEAADPDTIIRFPKLADPGYVSITSRIHVEANYQLINDNLLDLSHSEYIHPLFQSPEIGPGALSSVASEGQEHNVVWSKVLMRNITSHQFAAMTDDRPRIDNWIDTYWYAPSNIHLDIGTRAPGSERGQGGDVETPSLHLLTPETETSTHYFWALIRNVRLADEELTATLARGLKYAFEVEDKPVVEMQQREIGNVDLMALRPALLPTDRAAVRARRINQALLEAEALAKTTT